METKSILSAAALFGVGTVIGLGWYLNAGEPTEHHSPGTEAFPVFAALSVLTALGVFWLVRRRGAQVLLAPYGKPAAARLRRTLRSGGPLARAVVVFLLALNAYSLMRAGAQVTAGLDTDFTKNAWGGPSYQGAMYAHYLVAALIWGVSALLLDRVLLRVPSAGTTTHPRGASGSGRA